LKPPIKFQTICLGMKKKSFVPWKYIEKALFKPVLLPLMFIQSWRKNIVQKSIFVQTLKQFWYR
jgi:hypothetical protein